MIIIISYLKLKFYYMKYIAICHKTTKLRLFEDQLIFLYLLLIISLSSRTKKRTVCRSSKRVCFLTISHNQLESDVIHSRSPPYPPSRKGDARSCVAKALNNCVIEC